MGDAKLRSRAIDCNPVGLGIERKQRRVGFDLLVLRDADLPHHARDLWRDGDRVGPDVGVFFRDEAAAHEIHDKPDGKGRYRSKNE